MHSRMERVNTFLIINCFAVYGDILYVIHQPVASASFATSAIPASSAASAVPPPLSPPLSPPPVILLRQETEASWLGLSKDKAFSLACCPT